MSSSPPRRSTRANAGRSPARLGQGDGWTGDTGATAAVWTSTQIPDIIPDGTSGAGAGAAASASASAATTTAAAAATAGAGPADESTAEEDASSALHAYLAHLKECEEKPPLYRGLLELIRTGKDQYDLYEAVWTSDTVVMESFIESGPGEPEPLGNGLVMPCDGCCFSTELRDTDTYVEAVAHMIKESEASHEQYHELLQDGWYRDGRFLQLSDVLHPRDMELESDTD